MREREVQIREKIIVRVHIYITKLVIQASATLMRRAVGNRRGRGEITMEREERKEGRKRTSEEEAITE